MLIVSQICACQRVHVHVMLPGLCRAYYSICICVFVFVCLDLCIQIRVQSIKAFVGVQYIVPLNPLSAKPCSSVVQGSLLSLLQCGGTMIIVTQVHVNLSTCRLFNLTGRPVIITRSLHCTRLQFTIHTNCSHNSQSIIVSRTIPVTHHIIAVVFSSQFISKQNPSFLLNNIVPRDPDDRSHYQP